MLMPCCSSVAKYSGICDAAGTGVPPSPPIAVVTPIRSLFSASPFRGSTLPDWSIMSIQPGETYLPRASISTRPRALTLPISREAAVGDRDVGEDPRIARAVEHAPVADDDVVLRRDARHRNHVPGRSDRGRGRAPARARGDR